MLKMQAEIYNIKYSFIPVSRSVGLGEIKLKIIKPEDGRLY